MAFEREKQAAASPKELERERERELEVLRLRAARRKALEVGKRTLVEDQAAAEPPARDFHREAMADVVEEMGSVARGERAGHITDHAAMGPAMWRVAEARAATMFRHAVDDGEIPRTRRCARSAAAVRRCRPSSSARWKTSSGSRSIYDSIKAQLTYIKATIDAGAKPMDDKLDKLLLGVYAAREFETSDPELAEVLFKVEYLFKRL